MSKATLPVELKKLLHEGCVIPAHPLALTAERKLDEFRQRQLTRYYIASGAGGIAVGVHSTQFEIRDPAIGLYEPVLSLAMEEVRAASLNHPFVKVAGVCGPTGQALKEAETARALGYDIVLLSMGGLSDHTDQQLLERTRAVAEIMPVFGFYLQPAVGGRVLDFNFWQQFAAIENVEAIKVAAFNRYQTIDAMRAVACSPRAAEIAMYTGNDDNIIADLLTPFRFRQNDQWVEKSFAGGLLGQFAVWTSKAVRLLERIKTVKSAGNGYPPELLAENIQLTDANAAIFDPGNHFHGCIPGIHEVLRRQGLLEGRWCLNPSEELSPGQAEEISRVYAAYPDLNDDEFVRTFLQSENNR